MKKTAPLIWEDQILKLVDQRKLPHEVVYHNIENLEQAHTAIKDMIVRGAPLIGFAALFGMVLWVKNQTKVSGASLKEAAEYLKTSQRKRGKKED